MPKVAVITPYFKEPLEVLEQCHRSVLDQASQGMEIDQFFIADGFPQAALVGWKAKHITLPSSHGDVGNTARGVGGMLAASEGYDFVTYLDADNWYHPGHIASLMDTHQRTNAPVCASWRTFHKPDGSTLDITEPAEDAFTHVDTNCYFIHRTAFEVLDVWLRMPKQLTLMGDGVFLAATRHARFPVMPTRQRTIAYRTTHAFHFQLAGLPAPEGAKPMAMTSSAQQWLLTQEGVGECVRQLGFWPASYW